MKRVGVISLVAAVALSSSLYAAVQIAKDRTGDYLVAPIVETNNNYETEVTLMNVDNEHSFMLRCTVWNYVNSQEIIDFDVMLSPGDVWSAKFTLDPNDPEVGRIDSDDDSNWDGSLHELLVDNNGRKWKTGYMDCVVVQELNNNHPEVQAALERSNYSNGQNGVNYLAHTVDVYKLNKTDLKEFFARANGGYNVAERIGEPQLDYIVPLAEINQDAVGGYVTVSSTTNASFRTTIPMMAVEGTRLMGSQTNENFLPGSVTDKEALIGDGKEVRDLFRFKYVAAPYSLDNSDMRMNFVFIEDGYEKQRRFYKQSIRNMSEKYPKEIAGCPEDLIAYIKANPDKFPDAANPNISPYNPPTCTISGGGTPVIYDEMAGIRASKAIEYEANKKYTRVIEYDTKNEGRKSVVEELKWNDVNVSDYQAGMLQIHSIITDTTPPYNSNQYLKDGKLEAAYIPTFFEIKIIDNKPFLNWNYAITVK